MKCEITEDIEEMNVTETGKDREIEIGMMIDLERGIQMIGTGTTVEEAEVRSDIIV